MAYGGIGGAVATVAVGALVIYAIDTGVFGNVTRGGKADDLKIAEAVEAAKPDNPAEAWGKWRPNPVAGFDDEVTEESFFVEAPEVVELAWGWSQSRSEPIPTVCIEYRVDSRTAQSSDIRITEVRDSYALSKAMNVSASASVKGVGYQVSGKASFASNSEVSSSSVTYLVTAEVLNSADYVGPPGEGDEANTSAGAVLLTDEARALALRDMDLFQTTCGEGFISATISGARAYLLAETQTTSSSERKSVRASVQGSGWGVKVAAAAGTDSSSSTSNLTRNITFYQQGGAATPDTDDEDAAQTTLPKDAEEAIQRITELPVAAASAGKIFELQVTPYQVLRNFPRGEDILAAEAEQDALAGDWGAYATLYDDLKDVLENPNIYQVPVKTCADGACTVQFVPVADADGPNPQAVAIVEALQDMTLRAMNELEIAADICLMMEEDCDYDPSLVRSPYAVRAGMPTRIGVSLTKGDFAGNLAEVNAYGTLLDNTIKALADSEDKTTAQARLSAVLKADVTVLPTTLEDHLVQHLREPSLGRCVFGANTSGCIENTEIRGWAERTGLANVVSLERETLKAQIATCEGLTADDILLGDADRPDAPTVWFPVAAMVGEDGKPGCVRDALLNLKYEFRAPRE